MNVHPTLSRPRPRSRARSLAVGGLTLGLMAVPACSGSDKGFTAADPNADCIQVPAAVSSEKVELLQALARDFNSRSTAKGAKDCVNVTVKSKSSGGAATQLAEGWKDSADDPRPVIWSPAASSWGAVLNQRLADAGRSPMVNPDAPSFMRTPLVVAMPKPMADALGYPAKPVGWADLLRLATDPAGWATLGHPEWGPFRLGKTNPNFSTSGLSALIAQNYAAAGKTAGLTAEDLGKPEVVAFNKGIESSVVHYGDITMTFLNNWYRADRRGTALRYASAVAVEEKSIIDYNLGNPDGRLDPGEQPRPPKIPLVAVYPAEGTLFSDNPLYIVTADWVKADQRSAAERFAAFVQEDANQEKVLKYGFRPGNPKVAVTDPIVAANGADPDQPQTRLPVPDPGVLLRILDNWSQQRKGARVLLVLDVSGSMSDPADQSNPSGATKFELAQQATADVLDDFAPTDEVGLRVFSTDDNGAPYSEDLVKIGPISTTKEQMRRKLRELQTLNGTPLYDVTGTGLTDMAAAYDPTRINAVILLTDGRNDDGNTDDDARQRTALLNQLRDTTEGENSKPVRVFTIGYGTDADTSTLQAIAEAGNAAFYAAGDATTITKVLTQVVSNF